MASLSAALLAPSPAVLAADEPPLAYPPPPAAENRAASGDARVMRTESGELRWTPGAAEVEVRARDGRVLHRIPLARPDRKPRAPDVTLRALLPPHGRHFLVVEEYRKDVGLHLATRKGAKKAKATVVKSVLRLVDESSRVLWERATEDKTAVGEETDPQHLQIAPDGTVALLLQDVDPYAKNRPILKVVDPRGREALRLDYTAWTRVDEFALSPDGRSLVVHGFGLVPEDGEMSRAVGFYRLGKGPRWIKGLPRDPAPRLKLAAVDANGWTCCVDTPEGWTAYNDAGLSRKVGADEMWKQFGVR